ncbi:hypothetical protein [Clostridium sp. AF22-10]|uniref:hypothetical protein n=1 Tax=Clostridium sp. AF22-10 TaxID=2293004 RepID=UPI000E4DE4DF|nr:hypothetical protein DWX91_15060 [Clostridium sp. AF22-10]
MRIINRGRGTGKTAMLISTAYVTGKPIITSTKSNKNSLMDMAKTMCMSNNIEVYTINEWLEFHRSYTPNNEILIDDVDLILGEVLSKFLNVNVIAGTMTVPMDDVKNDIKETDKKHGYWLALDECANEGVYCSVCNKKVYKLNYANQKLKSKYCPNCGAIMDGKEATETDKNDDRPQCCIDHDKYFSTCDTCEFGE